MTPDVHALMAGSMVQPVSPNRLSALLAAPTPVSVGSAPAASQNRLAELVHGSGRETDAGGNGGWSGLSPGRSSVVGYVGAAIPGPLGTMISGVNAALGAIAGVQQADAMAQVTGVAPDTLGMAASGATGLGMSTDAQGLGGYGTPGVGGITGMQNALDPGVNGIARAMAADFARAFAATGSIGGIGMGGIGGYGTIGASATDPGVMGTPGGVMGRGGEGGAGGGTVDGRGGDGAGGTQGHGGTGGEGGGSW